MVRYIATHEQTANILKKPLTTTRFEYLRGKLCVWPSPPTACGVLLDQDLPLDPSQARPISINELQLGTMKAKEKLSGTTSQAIEEKSKYTRKLAFIGH